MHIFLDESGTFAPQPGKKPRMCCVATLAVSESGLERLHALHGMLMADWKPPDGELKSRTLTERNFNRVLTVLARHDVVPTIVAIDMALQTEAQITAHKLGQAAKLRDSASGPGFLESFRQEVHDLASRLERLSNQLYVQSFVQTQAMARTMRVATMHFAQTDPQTLGSYAWRVDAKGRTVQQCELLWVQLVKPFLQTIFLRKPLLQVRGAGFDYSAMAPFENPEQSSPPAHLAKGTKRKDGPFLSNDLSKLIEDLSFVDSRSSKGVQFADVLAGVFSRACNGHLKERGWDRLGEIMIRHPEDGQAVSYLSLEPTASGDRPGDQIYGHVVRRIEANAKDFEVQRAP